MVNERNRFLASLEGVFLFAFFLEGSGGDLIRLHLITPPSISLKTYIHFLVHRSDDIDYLHLRRPHFTEEQVREEIEFLLHQGFPKQKIIVHDHPKWVDVYQLSGAQLGKRSEKASIVRAKYPLLRLGASIHTMHEIEDNEKYVDYFLLGTLFATSSKVGIQPHGIEGVRPIIQKTKKPVVLIGGIKPYHLPELEKIGASGVAIMSGVLGAMHPDQALNEYLKYRGDPHA